MHQTFNTLFDLGKAAVVGEVGDRGGDAGAFRITAGDIDPRIVAQLLHAQADAVLFAVELQNLDGNFVADVDHFARMADTPPGHVGDVQQTVDTAEVNKRTVVGEVLDDAFDFLAFLQRGQQLLALDAVLFFEHRAAGNHDVVALLVELDDLELERLAFQVRGFPQRSDIDQGTGQERADVADIDGKATFDLAVDDAGHHFALLERIVQHHPGLCPAGLLTGEPGLPEAVVDDFHRNFDLIPDTEAQLDRSHRKTDSWG